METIEQELEWCKLIREEMEGEGKNEMKRIAKDWGLIKKQYRIYKTFFPTVQEAFDASLRDCGYLKKE